MIPKTSRTTIQSIDNHADECSSTITVNSHKWSSLTERSSSTPSSSSSSCKPEKQVTFKARTRARRTIPRSEYTPEELEATWFGKHEMLELRADAIRTVRRLTKQKPLKQGECKRGLECRTNLEVHKRQELITRVRQAVFDEQDRQRVEGLPHDEDAIASQYIDVSRDSIKTAISMAKFDRRAALLTSQITS